MDYPPREVLRVPDRMPALPPGIDPFKQEVLGLLTEGEAMSGEHLHHSVSCTATPANLRSSKRVHVWGSVSWELMRDKLWDCQCSICKEN